MIDTIPTFSEDQAEFLREMTRETIISLSRKIAQAEQRAAKALDYRCGLSAWANDQEVARHMTRYTQALRDIEQLRDKIDRCRLMLRKLDEYVQVVGVPF